MVTDDVFAVIAEATRRDILVSLRAGDKAVGELVEELSASQPTISKHLKVLREAQLVSMRAQGQKRYYALNPKPLEGIVSWLETFDVGPGAAVAKSLRAAGEAGAESAVAAPLSDNVAVAAVLERPGAELSPAVVIPGGTVAPLSDDTVPQQIGRTVGRAATKAADLLANLPNLPKFGRKK
ncbi:metalloregulator ArsR/SmtB family transcription factor [Pseudarthrobacter sp. RMG13]|uniref:Metalloregulator ArsR/SmtB family transcription factor n=1 Tax=Pseudarthrobacter humi TaxID=2952523 RepID=A0ABT1LRJ4_9MICC|nr:metalloregulator ArsR/SmtB family transcription factor [Pseudarthrobacter humi]MCP9001068.1 metalloregulator ArsR/SmtB family transcription factor [Pseudarthrobacter humi]